MVKFASMVLDKIEREKGLEDRYTAFAEMCATRLFCRSYHGDPISYDPQPFALVIEKVETLPKRYDFSVTKNSLHCVERKSWGTALKNPPHIHLHPHLSRADTPRVLAHEVGHLVLRHGGSIKWNQVHEFEAELFSFLFNLENGHSTLDASLDYVTAPIFFRRHLRLEEVARKSKERVLEAVGQALDLVQ